jgi:hypothetical protein
MVDKLNPTNQFHPYQPADATPVSERPATSGLGAIGDKLKGVDVRSQVNKARELARSNPAIALGGLAAAAIGFGLMRKRGM